MKRLLAFCLIASVYSACDDPDYKPTEITPTMVSYLELNSTISESSAGHEVVIQLEELAEGDGKLEIEISNAEAYGNYFTTEPAASGGKILLAIVKGDTEVSFQVLPIDNTKLNGHRAAAFSIVQATGSVKLGESVDYILTFVDDELTNKLMMYEKNGSALVYNKNNYEYNENGSVSKVYWESRTGFGSGTGLDEYFYNEAGGITKISRFDGAQQTKYTWDEGLIVKVELVQNDVVMSYNVYEYYESGLVRNVDFFSKDMAGDFVSTTYVSYSYFEDGNVHKIVQYSFNNQADEFLVTSITTYEDYVEGHNPTPLEVLPGQQIQTKLPTYYSRQVASGIQEYNIAYEFLENGNLLKKTVTGAISDSGVTTYTYY